jgi:hypothetical protein
MEAWNTLDAKDLNKTLSCEELRALEKAKAAIAGEGGRKHLTFEELLSVLKHKVE